MIYRIHPNIKKFMMLQLECDNARKALGEETDFYIDERPISYKETWQPMEVNFADALNGKKKQLPDISVNVGKIFLSQKAYISLRVLLKDFGELLPVTHEKEKGYIFNCLIVAKTNKKLSFNDCLNDKFSIFFEKDETANRHIFKADIALDGHFCSQEFKDIVENNHLTGISFSTDIGNPFPEELQMRNNH